MTEHLKRYKKGRAAEWAAAFLLCCKGYRFLAWRYKTSHGEIDLIMARGNTLVFVEVKARSDYQTGVEAISPSARQRIQNAASHFVARFPRYQNYVWRFDVVVVSPKRLPYHVKEAWRP